jgi:hypothetical protein
MFRLCHQNQGQWNMHIVYLLVVRAWKLMLGVPPQLAYRSSFCTGLLFRLENSEVDAQRSTLSSKLCSMLAHDDLLHT